MDVETSGSSPISTPPDYSPTSEQAYLSAANLTYPGNLASVPFKPAETTQKKPRKRKETERAGEEKKSRARDPSKPTARKKMKTSENNTSLTGTGNVQRPTFSNGDTAPQTLHPTTSVSPTSAQTQRPLSSGQRFDPIRSASAENAITSNSPYSSPSRLAPPQPSSHPRASPSIASLIDPNPPRVEQSSPTSRQPNPTPSTKRQSPPAVPRSGSPAVVVNGSTTTFGASGTKPAVNGDDASKDGAGQKTAKPENSTKASSPKPGRSKDALAALAAGTGLLSNAAFGVANAGAKEYAKVPNQCIVIEVPMKADTGTYVNFMKEVENKYGFDVAHPRQAEHKRRMKEIAAAGAALESAVGSADEMPIDESDASSDVEMKGDDDNNNNSGAAPAAAAAGGADGSKKRRKLKEDYYDKNDDFIDDSELMWEEQALATKNGYFVWSGPLVNEGDKPPAEKRDGAGPRRGGRGRGSRGGARGEASTRGRTSTGPGPRGGRGPSTTARKPRITKADRARMETEKQERERMASTATKPSQYPGIVIQ